VLAPPHAAPGGVIRNIVPPVRPGVAVRPRRPPRSRRWRAAAAAALAGLLAACAAPAPVDTRQAWQAHLAWLEGLSDWRTRGRLAVSVPEQSWSANLRWRQRGAEYRVWLGGPFGQGAVRIEGGEDGVELRTADGRRQRAASPERLLAGELGVEVPVSLLRYWILGRPAPAPPVTGIELDPAGRLARLEQAGWEVRYARYEEAGAGSLPARLDVQREGMRARFVLGGWETG